jgi:hypothetical protein
MRAKQAKGKASTEGIVYSGRKDLEHGDYVRDEDYQWYIVKEVRDHDVVLVPCECPDAWKLVVELRACIKHVIDKGRNPARKLAGVTDVWADHGEDVTTTARNLYAHVDRGLVWTWYKTAKCDHVVRCVKDKSLAEKVGELSHAFYLECAAKRFRWPKLIRRKTKMKLRPVKKIRIRKKP